MTGNKITDGDNLSGYDSRYCGSFFNRDEAKTAKAYTDTAKLIHQKHEQVSFVRDHIISYRSDCLNNLLSETSDKSLINTLERYLSDSENLPIADRFNVYEKIVRGRAYTVTEKLVLLNEINSHQQLDLSKKIIILDNVLKKNALYDKELYKHINNKIILLKRLKESGYNHQVLSAEYKKELLAAEDSTKGSDAANDKLTDNGLGTSKATGNIELGCDNPVNSEDATSTKKKEVSCEKNPQLNNIDTITRMTVNSKEYFKFGAGVRRSGNGFSLIVPSGYTIKHISNTDVVYFENIFSNNLDEINVKSPLVFTVCMSKEKNIQSLFQFFNYYIKRSVENKEQYIRTVVDGSACVLSHKKGSNIFEAAVFNDKRCYCVNIKFYFNRKINNKYSVVQRILWGVDFGGAV